MEESVKTTLELFSPEKLIVPDEETPVALDSAPALITNPLMVLVDVLPVIVPLISTAKFAPLITLVPVAVPRVNVPKPFCSRVNPVLVVDGEIMGFAPEKVNPVDVKVLLLIVLSTVNAPLVWIFPLLEMVAPVEV